MNQEITYSAKLFPFLYEDPSPYELTPQKEIWQIIKQNYIVVDKKRRLLEKYAEEVLSLPKSDRKNVLKDFIDGLVNNKGNLIKVFSIESKENLEVSLSLFSNDKIYFVPNEKERLQTIVVENPKLEVHDYKSFINPAPEHRLKNLPTLIDLKESKRYNIRDIIKPFLRNTKTIEIVDPYLPNIEASVNFFRIIKNIKGIHTKLFFMNRNAYMKDSREDFQKRVNRYDGFIDKLTKLKKLGYFFEIKDQLDKGHKERYIFTDTLQIYLPGGFDFYDKHGFIKRNSGKKELRIEKRKF